MKGKATLLTLCASSSPDAFERLARRLSALGFSPETRDFGDAKSLASGASSLVSLGGIIIAAAPLRSFINAKAKIMKAGFAKIVRSSAIVSAMGADAPKNPEERDFQAAVPAGATAIPSGDGFYSAFVAEKDDSTLIFLPLDVERLDYIFDFGLNKILSKYVLEKENKRGKKYVFNAAAFKNDVLSAAASGKTTAISSGGSGSIAAKAIAAAGAGEKAFKRDFSDLDRLPGESVENYTARNAKLSKENSRTDYGVSVSEICRDKKTGDAFVVVCAADSERAEVAKTFAEPDESDVGLIAAAIEKLGELLNKVVCGDGLKKAVPVETQTKEKFKLPVAVASVCVAAAVVASLIVAFAFGNRRSEDVGVGAEEAFEPVVAETSPVDEYGYEYYFGEVSPEPLTPEPLNYKAERIPAEALNAEITYVTEKPPAVETTFAQTTATAVGAMIAVAKTTAKTTVKTTSAPTSEIVKETSSEKPPETTSAKPATTQRKNPESSTSEKKTDSTSNVGTSGTSPAGKFVFRVYGYGHGVGMSQDGAIRMAKDGKDHKEILKHYFKGAAVKTDSETPKSIRYGGKDIPIVEYLCRTTKREIGEESPKEALKAQLVAVYTFAKWYDFDVEKSRHAYSDEYEYEGSQLHKACLEVLSMKSDADPPKAEYVDYGGEAALTCYFDSAAGKTASAESVWEGTSPGQYPYLKGGAESPEEVEISNVEISADEMKKYISDYAEKEGIEIKLSEDPAEWLEILSHDSSYNERTGYVNRLRIGDREIKGSVFRRKVLEYEIRSHCFTFEYVPD